MVSMFLVPAVMFGLFCIPFGIELFSDDHNEGDNNDHTTDTSGDDFGDATQVDLQIASNEDGSTYGVFADNSQNDDHRYGTSGDDKLFGGSGDDILYGADGTDIVVGESGDDMLYGNDGNDHVYGNEFWNQSFTNAELIEGLNDNHTYYNLDADTNSGTDHLFGGAGNDALYLGNGDIAEGGSGDDQFIMLAQQMDENNLAVINDYQAGETLKVYFANEDDDMDLSLVERPDGSVIVQIAGKDAFVINNPPEGFSISDVETRLVFT